MRHLHAETLAKQLVLIAREAEEAFVAVNTSGVTDIQSNQDKSPVTEADLAAHRVLATQLKSLLSECSVLSEEDVGSLAHRPPIFFFSGVRLRTRPLVRVTSSLLSSL